MKKKRYNIIEKSMRDYVRTLREKAENDAHGLNSDDCLLHLGILKKKMADLCIPDTAVDSLYRPAYYSSMDDGGASYEAYDAKIDEIIESTVDNFSTASILYTMTAGNELSACEKEFALLYANDGNELEQSFLYAIVDFSDNHPVCTSNNYREILDEINFSISPNTSIEDKSLRLSSELLYHEVKNILDAKSSPVINYQNRFRAFAAKMLKKTNRAIQEANNHWTADNAYFIGRYIGDSTSLNADIYIARDLLRAKVKPERVAEELAKNSPMLFTSYPPDARLKAAMTIVNDVLERTSKKSIAFTR